MTDHDNAGPVPVVQEEWLLSGGTIYTLVEDGWRKGKPVMRNRVWFQVQVDRRNGGDAEAAAVAAHIHRRLAATPTPSLGGDEAWARLVYALEDAELFESIGVMVKCANLRTLLAFAAQPRAEAGDVPRGDWYGYDRYVGGKFEAGYLLDRDQEPDLREVARFNCASLAEPIGRLMAQALSAPSPTPSTPESDALAKARAEERERCARIAAETPINGVLTPGWLDGAASARRQIAAAIRATAPDQEGGA